MTFLTLATSAAPARGVVVVATTKIVVVMLPLPSSISAWLLIVAG
jgi:hypothetical protein